MRPAGVIVGACAWTYGAAPLAETLERIAAAGCDGVELPGEPDQIRPADACLLLARHRLTPVALTASCSVETRRDLAHPDPAVRSDAVAYVVRCLRFAAECGIPLVQVLPSAETRLAPLAAREDEWRWSIEGVRAAAREQITITGESATDRNTATGPPTGSALRASYLGRRIPSNRDRSPRGQPDMAP